MRSQVQVAAGKFANLCLYSDVVPFEVVRVVSDKTIEIREMKADRDPTWKPEMHAGGFAAHCSNQNEQRWLIAADEDRPVIRARLRKDGRFHSKRGAHRLSDTPQRFHDYNF